MAQIDRCFNDDSFTTMIQRIQSLSYHYEGRLQLHLIGGFSDRNRVAHSLSVALLRKSISISIHRECVSSGAAGAQTRRSLGHHLLHLLILRLLVLIAPPVLRTRAFHDAPAPADPNS